jgi:hypothetical protein
VQVGWNAITYSASREASEAPRIVFAIYQHRSGVRLSIMGRLVPVDPASLFPPTSKTMHSAFFANAKQIDPKQVAAALRSVLKT